MKEAIAIIKKLRQELHDRLDSRSFDDHDEAQVWRLQINTLNMVLRKLTEQLCHLPKTKSVEPTSGCRPGT